MREYEDEEFGRGAEDRPQFQRMMEETRSERKPFGTIIVCDRSRFAAGFEQHAKELRDAGVEVLWALDEPPGTAERAQDPALWRRKAA